MSFTSLTHYCKLAPKTRRTTSLQTPQETQTFDSHEEVASLTNHTRFVSLSLPQRFLGSRPGAKLEFWGPYARLCPKTYPMSLLTTPSLCLIPARLRQGEWRNAAGDRNASQVQVVCGAEGLGDQDSKVSA